MKLHRTDSHPTLARCLKSETSCLLDRNSAICVSACQSHRHFILSKTSSGKALAANNRPLTFSICHYTHCILVFRASQHSTTGASSSLWLGHKFLSITLSYLTISRTINRPPISAQAFRDETRSFSPSGTRNKETCLLAIPNEISPRQNDRTNTRHFHCHHPSPA